MRHEYPPLKSGSLREVGKAPRVIKVEVGNQENVNVLGLAMVEVGETFLSWIPRVDSAVQQYRATTELK